jgi:hypothetical protein
MAITFEVDSTTTEGTFIRVLRDGRPFGKILDAVGLYRFYEADRARLGSADLKDMNLERLKTAIHRGTRDGDDDRLDLWPLGTRPRGPFHALDSSRASPTVDPRRPKGDGR